MERYESGIYVNGGASPFRFSCTLSLNKHDHVSRARFSAKGMSQLARETALATFPCFRNSGNMEVRLRGDKKASKNSN